jgi:hypothetical protein
MSKPLSVTAASVDIRCADEVWIAAALLHREHPQRPDFTIREIVNRAQREGVRGVLRKGVSVHASVHCVANRPPSPAGFRMLYATGKRTRRLYRPSDEAHPKRRGKMIPKREEIPDRYHYLVDWYEQHYAGQDQARISWLGGVRAMAGLGKEIWAGVDPDEYIRRLREGWG